MNSSFQDRCLFPRQVVIQLPKLNLTHIISEPKYKYRQQEQVTVRNHNRNKPYNNNNSNFISSGYHIWHGCQSNIWSPGTKTCMFFIITDRTKIIYRSTALKRSALNIRWELKPDLRDPNLALSFCYGSKHIVGCSVLKFRSCFYTSSTANATLLFPLNFQDW